MSKMKGNMCNFRTGVGFLECGVLFVILSTSVIVKQIRLLVKGAPGVVSVTDFPPLPGGRRSQVGPSESVCTGSEILLKRQNH